MYRTWMLTLRWNFKAIFVVNGNFRDTNTLYRKLVSPIKRYKFKRGFATPIIFIFDLRRNVPYFYDTFRVEKITLVAELNVIPDAPWR